MTRNDVMFHTLFLFILAYISTFTIPVPKSITSFQVQSVKSVSDKRSEGLDATGEDYKCYTVQRQDSNTVQQGFPSFGKLRQRSVVGEIMK